MEGRGSGMGMLVLVLVLVQAVGFASCQSTSFCANTLSRWTCPKDLPTFDKVDLQKYAGRWYEIGSNAFFKNLQEAGGTCVSAVYTLKSDEGYVEVFNSQTRVIGDLGVSLVRAISAQASQICQGARQICSQIFVGSVSQGLSIVQEVATNTSQSNPADSSALLEAKAMIESALGGIDAGLDSLAKNVSQMQILNSQLSQADGKAADRVAQLSDLAAQINAGVVDAIIPEKLAAIAAARQNITAIAGKLYNAPGTKQLAQLLFRAVTLIQDLEESVPGQAATIKATVNGAVDAAASFAYEKSENVGGFVTILGKAFQNSTDAGKLSVVFDSIAPAQYWILKVEDENSDDYGAAIVYGCSDLPTGGTYQPFFILSRKPTLGEDVGIPFLQYAESLGIYQDCHEVFAFSEQPATCQYPSPPTQ
ncbi:hypothetical protein MPTK1_3g05310 [Marchantia polymorpha subsp. ruderalis]